jgi:hypothetical protein
MTHCPFISLWSQSLKGKINLKLQINCICPLWPLNIFEVMGHTIILHLYNMSNFVVNLVTSYMLSKVTCRDTKIPKMVNHNMSPLSCVIVFNKDQSKDKKRNDSTKGDSFKSILFYHLVISYPFSLPS